ncbi:hypothetical protein EDC01DRAFT_777111 [Geopyxis carbonaria]|nr:hypothetical protein EDC01DRAFT_777111 [Geopyxis carbonaria]
MPNKRLRDHDRLNKHTGSTVQFHPSHTPHPIANLISVPAPSPHQARSCPGPARPARPTYFHYPQPQPQAHTPKPAPTPLRISAHTSIATPRPKPAAGAPHPAALRHTPCPATSPHLSPPLTTSHPHHLSPPLTKTPKLRPAPSRLSAPAPVHAEPEALRLRGSGLVRTVETGETGETVETGLGGVGWTGSSVRRWWDAGGRVQRCRSVQRLQLCTLQ